MEFKVGDRVICDGQEWKIGWIDKDEGDPAPYLLVCEGDAGYRWGDKAVLQPANPRESRKALRERIAELEQQLGLWKKRRKSMPKTFEELDKSAADVVKIIADVLNDSGYFDLTCIDNQCDEEATTRLYNGRLFVIRVTDTGDVDEAVLDEYNKYEELGGE